MTRMLLVVLVVVLAAAGAVDDVPHLETVSGRALYQLECPADTVTGGGD